MLIRRKRSKEIQIQTIPVTNPIRLVTFFDPTDDVSLAENSFARLQPEKELSSDAIERWREAVAQKAIAVKVLAPPRSAIVSPQAQRVEEDHDVGTIREEVTKLAEATKNANVIKLVKELCDEFGIR